MTVFNKIKLFFRRNKTVAKAQEPKPAIEAAKKEAPETPEKKS